MLFLDINTFDEQNLFHYRSRKDLTSYQCFSLDAAQYIPLMNRIYSIVSSIKKGCELVTNAFLWM